MYIFFLFHVDLVSLRRPEKKSESYILPSSTCALLLPLLLPHTGAQAQSVTRECRRKSSKRELEKEGKFQR